MKGLGFLILTIRLNDTTDHHGERGKDVDRPSKALSKKRTRDNGADKALNTAFAPTVSA